MPVYKQYKYYRIRDCPGCRYFKFGECHHPVPNDFNCHFITRKEFQHRYFFKTSILGRSFIRRGFATKEAARDAETEFRREIINGKSMGIQKSHLPTYRALLEEYYAFIKENLKSTYAVKIRRAIDNYYCKLYPDMPIDQLIKSDSDKVRKKIASECVSVQTKNDRLNFIRRFFQWIKKYYEYEYRYAFLIPQFRDYKIRRQKRKAQIVELSQFLLIYRSCASDYYRLALLTMFLFGLRISEQIGLTVDSFDFEENTMEIYQAVSYKTQRKGYVLMTPKTAAGKRILQMPKIYAAMIRKHIDVHHLKKKDFIFFRKPDQYSVPIHENTFRRHCETYCQTFSPDFHPHMLRTSICTHLQEKGIPLEEVAKYLGHEGIKVTEIYYSKESRKKKEEVTEALNRILEEIL